MVIPSSSPSPPRRKASKVEQQGELKRKTPLKSTAINTAISTFQRDNSTLSSPAVHKGRGSIPNRRKTSSTREPEFSSASKKLGLNLVK